VEATERNLSYLKILLNDSRKIVKIKNL